MTATTESALFDRLSAIAGAEHVSRSPELDVDGMRPALAVAPGTLEAAAAVLLAAREAGAVVAPWGGGTQQRIGPPSERLDVAVKTERLDAVVEWEPGDLTACLQAGLTLAEVRRRLAEQGQQLPLEAPDAERATLGGLVATNAAGPRRWRYGGWRDLIIGMHVALTDGTVIKSGGRVVKNVQGYDLAKLFIGSLGSLGVIGQINVKLVPVPATRGLIVCRGPLAAVSAFLAEVAASTIRASAVDLLDAAAAAACGLPVEPYAGLVLLEGQPTVVDDGSAKLRALAGSAGGRCDTVNGDALAEIVRRWADLGRTSDLSPDEALLTVYTLPAQVRDAVESVARASEQHAVGARIWARAGNGVVFGRLSTLSGDAALALPSVQQALLRRWPATTLVSGDPAVERAAKPWGADPPGLEQMRLIKQRFDPARILNPGRYVGGL